MKMNSLKGLLFLLVLFSSSIVFGQTITGTVTGDNLPLPGVNVVIEGTQTGTVTDFDGLYSIDGVQEGDVLVFSSIGFVTKSVTALGNSVINVNLEEDIKSLEEVVVVGYTKTTRGKLTTAVSSVEAEELAELPAATINDALEGRSSGVRVASNGSPGENKPVIIRGLSTFGDGTPLYVVDGVFVDNISQISPEAIAKVDILKDAAATAVYGSRGSNGVIIVTTKKGKAGKPKFGFSTYAGIQYLNQRFLPNLLSGPDLVNLLTEEDTVADDPLLDFTIGNQTPERFLEPGFVARNTDFTKELFTDAEIKNYNIDFSGGSDKATFSVNAGHFDQEGIHRQTRFRRYSLNINSNFKINDRFTVGQAFNIGFSRANLPILLQGRPLQNWAIIQSNYLPIRDAQGRFVNASRTLDNTNTNTNNPFLFLETSRNEQRQLNTYGNIYGEVKLLDGLSMRNSIAFNIFNQNVDLQSDSFSSDEGGILVGDGSGPLKNLTNRRITNLLTTVTSQLDYNKSFGNHNVNATAIFERTDEDNREFVIVNNSATSNEVDQFDSNGTTIANSVSRPETLTSYVGLAGYSYDNRYFLNGSIRRDASSVFADPVGIFPSVSAAWNLSNESFFAPVSGVVSNAKFRFGYGETGNNRINPFQDVVTLQTVVAPQIGGQESTGFVFRGQNQDDLTWETSVKTNYGVELGFLSDKITFTGEYYDNRSEDLIALGLASASSGDSTVGNVGSSRTNGIELSLGYNDNVGDFKWSFWGQITTANTEITNINDNTGATEFLGTALQAIESRTETGVSRLRIGQPIWGIYGAQTDGLYRTEDEIIDSTNSNGVYFVEGGSPTATLTRSFDADGNAQFVDGNGNPVDRSNVALDQARGTGLGDIRFVDNGGEAVLIGDPNPDFTYSFNLKGEYKNLDFSALFTGVQGVDVLNSLSVPARSNFGNSTLLVSALDRYSATNTTSSEPRFTAFDPNVNVRISDRFIEDGSYLRLRSLILGYSFKQDVLSSFFNGSLEKVRFYVQGQNLFTITDYSGLDPEIRPSFTSDENGNFTNTIGGLGIDRGTAPAPISFILGLQVGF